MSEDRAERRRRERAERKGQWAKEQDEHEIERDWEISPEWKAYVTHVRSTLYPMIDGSRMSLSIVPKRAEDVDVKFAVELGLCIMLNKPICLIVDPDTELPPALVRVADEIVRCDIRQPGAQDELMAAIDRMKALTGDDDDE